MAVRRSATIADGDGFPTPDFTQFLLGLSPAVRLNPTVKVVDEQGRASWSLARALAPHSPNPLPPFTVIADQAGFPTRQFIVYAGALT